MNRWPWLTLQVVAANVAVILALAFAWYLAFMQQSEVYSERLMSAFDIEPGQLHAMYVADVERQLWTTVIIGLCMATLASVGLAFLIVRPLRSLARATERLRHGDYKVRSTNEFGEIGQLAENINALATALEQEERRRAQYLTDLSHELRTPITSLRGYTEGLEDGVFKADREFYDLLKGELSQLTALTRTIDSMQLCQLETDESVGHSLSVESFFQDAVHRWSERLKECGHCLDVEITDQLQKRTIAVPFNVMRQVADNLISNMCRYASTGDSCRIRASKGCQTNSIELKFSNAAPDVDHASLPYLFDRFFRASESRTRQMHAHATGLGLSIVKQLCLSCDGNATAALDGQELVITVTLPLASQ